MLVGGIIPAVPALAVGKGSMSIIEITNLTKYYGKARGIENVSCSVEEGEIFGFIGPNGAGKSTTIRLLLSLIHPTSGSARVLGKDVVTHGPEIRRDIGYLPSEVYYYEGMRVIDLLKYSASFYEGDCTQRLHELSAAMELELKRRISDLSYGNKKKVGIVQGLLHSPKLLFLDEPTAGLDPLMQRRFFDLIRAENARGVTVFFSSHILGEVQRLCTRVGIIRNGSIAEISDIRTLQQNNYKKVRVTADGLNPAGFALPGVTNLQTDNGTTSFFYKGDINAVLQRLSALPVADVTIEEPTLEEIFMHYYE
jgi:ABC-2 type transport system ATP-binding protein